MILRAKNWEEFQHYKDRDPPWIKLHKRLLDDRVFHRLPDASRALAPMVWLLCSESKDGTIKDGTTEIAFRLRMTEKKAEEALNPLIEAGFFIVERDASTMLAPCEHDAAQRERQSRDREEEEERAFGTFGLAAKRNGWPEPTKLSDDRRKKLRARLDEHGLDGWQNMLDLADASEFLKNKFKLNLDWILEPKNFRKVIEGNYSGNQRAEPQKFNGNAAPTVPNDGSEWEARLRTYKPGGFWSQMWGERPEDIPEGRTPTHIPPTVLAAWRASA